MSLLSLREETLHWQCILGVTDNFGAMCVWNFCRHRRKLRWSSERARWDRQSRLQSILVSVVNAMMDSFQDGGRGRRS